jgi:hypothetical protein
VYSFEIGIARHFQGCAIPPDHFHRAGRKMSTAVECVKEDCDVYENCAAIGQYLEKLAGRELSFEIRDMLF